MTNENEEIESPCVGVCTLDDSTGFCLGCYRTGDEIRNWWDKTNAEKKEILALVEARTAASFD